MTGPLSSGNAGGIQPARSFRGPTRLPGVRALTSAPGRGIGQDVNGNHHRLPGGRALAPAEGHLHHLAAAEVIGGGGVARHPAGPSRAFSSAGAYFRGCLLSSYFLRVSATRTVT